MNTLDFSSRHNGPDNREVEAMLKKIGVSSVDELINETIPASIRLKKDMDIPESVSEYEFLNELKKISLKNKVFKSYIGLGYYNCITPGVILRNIFENPGWYTAYTPYQAEIAQGRLEALLNFQTMVIDLTGMEIANASLLDEATAAAEAMLMLFNTRSKEAEKANRFFVSDECFPQTIDVLKTRSAPLGIKLVIGNHHKEQLNERFFGALLQYPSRDGNIHDYSSFTKEAHSKGIQIAVSADILSLTLLTPPGEWGADVVVGSTQRFGVPLGYGGPHAAYFATKEQYKRNMPGRIIGVSVDSHGNRALRMALQTREQHIRREKATSNICTSQVLLAVMAGMYAVYHGPSGLKNIAQRIHSLANKLTMSLESMGFRQLNTAYFDTIKIDVGDKLGLIKKTALKAGVNFRYIDKNTVGISIDETTSEKDIEQIVSIFASFSNVESIPFVVNSRNVISGFERKTDYLKHTVFNSYHSETAMLRYLKKLENRDLSLVHAMIPLGSCTMKLNATTEMMPLSWPEFSSIHPFVPVNQALGYAQIIKELEKDLCTITGFSGVSLQPNSGAQGEYAGLIVIRKYHKSKGESHRNIVLIPSSAHGTNPATAVMVGMKVVVVRCDDQGNVDLTDLKQKAEQFKDKLAALMITYPSTHGVYEEGIKEITKIIHDCGGQVYMDGANMNAQVGLTNPGMIGADVCHLNLHKTFAIPHGGGGPGMGPIAVAAHLVPFLPSHPLIKIGNKQSSTAISAAPWGSASILIISYAYIKLLGKKGLVNATKMAILNANYIKAVLEEYYPILYKGKYNRIAHEMIVDCRQFKMSAQVEVEDIAKRLIDYGFHAPTVSFPVAGTLMVEPTESESKDELDRFCEAMISIRKEIKEIENGIASREDNVLKNAPHSLLEVTSNSWNHKYAKEKAVYPIAWVKENKFWPSVGRVDNAYGDRNLICSCPSVENYSEELASYL